jgi:hypothetical protein
VRRLDFKFPSAGWRPFVAGVLTLFLLGWAALGSAKLANAGQVQASKRAVAAPGTALTPAAATGAFGLNLVGAQPPGNVVLAPASVATALAMAGTGASGQTAAQMAETLHLRRTAGFGSMNGGEMCLSDFRWGSLCSVCSCFLRS